MTEVPGGVPAFEPFIRYPHVRGVQRRLHRHPAGEWFVDQYLVKHEFIKRLHTRFEQEEIVVPFPIRTIAQRDAPAGSLPREMVGGV